MSKRYPEETIQKAYALFDKNLSPSAVAKAFGIPKDTVRYWYFNVYRKKIRLARLK